MANVHINVPEPVRVTVYLEPEIEPSRMEPILEQETYLSEKIISVIHFSSYLLFNISMLCCVLDLKVYNIVAVSAYVANVITMIYMISSRAYLRNTKLIYEYYNSSTTFIILTQICWLLLAVGACGYPIIIIGAGMLLSLNHEFAICIDTLRRLSTVAVGNHLTVRICMLLVCFELLMTGNEQYIKIVALINAVFTLIMMGYLQSNTLTKHIFCVQLIFLCEFIACSYLYVVSVSTQHIYIVLYMFNVCCVLVNGVVCIDTYRS
jgi:hypothetical protein